MSFPGFPPMGGAGAGANAGMSEQEQYMIKMVNAAAESCPVKIAMSTAAGFVLGGAFGFLGASLSYDTAFTNQGAEMNKLPMREQLKIGFKDMGSRSWSMGKNFAYIGGIYTAVECSIEGLRAKNDLTNHVAAGCITGAYLGRNAGPQAALTGCVGFAAFSTAIEAWMRMPGEE